MLKMIGWMFGNIIHFMGHEKRSLDEKIEIVNR